MANTFHAGIYTWTKPKDEIEKSFNKEAMAILETKRAELVLDMQAIGSGHIVTRKLKANFLDYYQDYCDKNKSAPNRALPNSLMHFKKFLKIDFISPIEVTENLAKQFRKYLMDILGGQTPLDYFSRFKRVVEAAESDGYFKKNPVAKVLCQSHPSHLKETLEPKEWNSFYIVRTLYKGKTSRFSRRLFKRDWNRLSKGTMIAGFSGIGYRLFHWNWIVQIYSRARQPPTAKSLFLDSKNTMCCLQKPAVVARRLSLMRHLLNCFRSLLN